MIYLTKSFTLLVISLQNEVKASITTHFPRKSSKETSIASQRRIGVPKVIFAASLFGAGILLLLWGMLPPQMSREDQAKAHAQMAKALSEFDDLYRRQVQLLIDQSQAIEKVETQQLLLELLEKDLGTIDKALQASEDLEKAKVSLLKDGQLGIPEEVEFLKARENLKTYLVLTDL